MGYEYVLIDNWWDTNIGRERMKDFIDYAHSKNVDVFLWYSSSGYWNDIVQGPTNYMDNPIIRKKEMKWLHNIGVKGIKVDFFGGDKQETMRLYEAILSDADDNGLMVIFHGCTLPRGWERMYPNYVGSEAVLASENLIFQQHFAMKKHLMPVCIHLSATPSVAWSLVAHSSTNASTATMTAEAYARPLMYSNWQQPFYSKILFRILRWRLIT